MDQKNLLNYLRAVLEMEKQKRTMQLALREKASVIAKSGRPREIEGPSWMDEPRHNTGQLFLGSILIFFGLVGVFFLSFGGSGFLLFIGCLPLGLGCFLLFEERKDWNSAKKRYEDEQMEYIGKKVADEDRVMMEKAMLPEIQKDCVVLDQQLTETKEALDQLYSLNIVYTGYRSIVPIAMFVQYLESGRCTQLEGHEGCYNLYESELRQNIIIAKLDVIIEKLDQIKAAQYELRQTILQSNSDIERLCNRQLEVYEQHEAIAQYQRQQIANTQRIMSQYALYRDLI